MKKHFLSILLLFAFVALNGQNLNLGIKLQKTHSLYWENGITARYSFENFKSDQFYIGLDYISSRIGSAFASNAIKQDNLIGSVGWHYRKDKPFRFITKINFGFLKADLEEDVFSELPNSAILLSPEVGFSYGLKNFPIIAHIGLGFNFSQDAEAKSLGTFQPLFYHLSFYYTFQKIKKDEKI